MHENLSRRKIKTGTEKPAAGLLLLFTGFNKTLSFFYHTQQSIYS